MLKYENDCVNCGLHCVGGACKYYDKVPHYYCDKCGEEATLYHFDGEELCMDCINDQLEVIEGSEW